MARVVAAAAFFCCACLCSVVGGSPSCNTGLVRSLWAPSSGYDKLVRPKLGADPPTPSEKDDVFGEIQVFSVVDVDTVHQTFTLEAYIRVIWVDGRLNQAGIDWAGTAGCTNRSLGFPSSPLEEIWAPDMVFQNAVRPATTLFEAWWLNGTGRVWWARKVHVTLSCRMDFTRLPFDIQRCPVQMFGWRVSGIDVEFHLRGTGVRDAGLMLTAGAVDWHLGDIEGRIEKNNTVWGCNADCVGIVWTIPLARKSDYFMYYVVMPSWLLVSMAWASLWVSRSAAPARVAMGIICFLTITGQISSVLSSLPRLDGSVWLLKQLEISRLFVFISIVEYSICNVLGRIEKRLAKARDLVASEGEAAVVSQGEGEAPDQCVESGAISVRQRIKRSGSASYPTRMWSRKDGHMIVSAHHIDIFARVAFPVAYAVIVVVNWDP